MIRNHRLMTAMGIRPKTIIHVGSHFGQDNHQYERLKVPNIFWCEADPICVKELRSRYPRSQVVEGIFWSAVGMKMDFWLMPNRAQNSLFNPKKPSENIQKMEVVTTTIDKVFGDLELAKPIMLILDVQGAEIEVLRGATKILPQVTFLICEITKESTISEFSVTQGEIESLLTPFRYKRSIRRWSHSGEYYDQLFLNSTTFARARILFLDLTYKFILLLKCSRRNFIRSS